MTVTMDCLNKIIVFLIFVLCGCCGGLQGFEIPNVTFEVLNSGSFRAFIPAVSGISYFGLDVEFNQQELKGHADDPKNNHFIVNFDKKLYQLNRKLKTGDWIFYTIRINCNGLHYTKEGEKEITGLLDSYSVLGQSKNNTKTFTSRNSGSLGEAIIEDNFNGPVIDNQKWTVEQKIPTYHGINDNYFFNSYEKADDTCFIKDGILYLKPVARADVSGVLDLSNGCTSSHRDKQCYWERNRGYIVPPVKSGRITSKVPFKYGKVEIKAKMPRGDWIVPVIQLQLKETHIDEESPKLVIAYSRGNDQLCGSGEEDVGSRCLFAGPMLSSQNNTLLKKKHSNTSYNRDFHIYKLAWTSDKMTFSVDSTPYGEATIHSSPEHNGDLKKLDTYFNKQYVLSLGVAVGGNYDFPDHCNLGNSSKPWNNNDVYYAKKFFDAKDSWLKTWNDDDTALKIDYVKVWAI